jgi:CRISPR/Cas system-associated endonuclease Cas1
VVATRHATGHREVASDVLEFFKELLTKDHLVRLAEKDEVKDRDLRDEAANVATSDEVTKNEATNVIKFM